jgi:prolyl-tRNA synthetase
MTHSDDDGLVLPPRLAPQHVVILPIFRNDEEESKVMEYCRAMQSEIAQLQYHGEPIRVTIDQRDMRGGDKKWFQVKRGVPVRLEVGPRDIESNSVFVGRRDQPKSFGMNRSELCAKLADILSEIQNGLFERALQLRKENTREITSMEEFREYFTPKDPDRAEIHGGFAHCHFVDCPETDEILKPLKVTPRCMPLDDEKIPGTCLFTGRKTVTRAIFGKSY